MNKSTNPWKTLSSRVIHQSRWLTLYVDDVIKPNGTPGTYTYIQSPPFVLIVGYDGERFVFVRQYRYPLKREMMELPGGNLEEGEDLLASAKREFEEETGLQATKWTKLGLLHNPNLATVFLAEQLTKTGHEKMREDGIDRVTRLNWPEIDELIARGEFTDSKTLAALLLFERHRTKA